jgi:outer membrane receptor for ferric coprogen and ferric-rhodotorulic acid
LFGDLQFRSVNYQADGVQANSVDDTFNFFNPKTGLTYDIDTNNALYFPMLERIENQTERIMRVERKARKVE